MTEKQIKKVTWLNRLYFMSLKLDSLYSLKESDREKAEKLIEKIPDKDDPLMVELCKKILLSRVEKSSQKYLEILKIYNNIREEIENAIEKIDDMEYQSILTAHYIERKPWAKIAEEVFLGLRTVKYKHLKALDLLKINI